MSQEVHQARAYLDFSSMKQLEVFLLPPVWDASPSQGYPLHYRLSVPIYTPERRAAQSDLSVFNHYFTHTCR